MYIHVKQYKRPVGGPDLFECCTFKGVKDLEVESVYIFGNIHTKYSWDLALRNLGGLRKLDPKKVREQKYNSKTLNSFALINLTKERKIKVARSDVY